jgi:WD40 repeat protein
MTETLDAGVPPPSTLPCAAAGATLASTDPDGANGWERNAIPGYVILGEIARGGMGVVYKALQTALNRVVALKMVLVGAHASQELRAHFRLEAEAVARLRNPHVVQVFDLGEQDRLPYFVMEYVEGIDLHERLRGTPVSPRAAAGLVETLARTMYDVHKNGQVLHRDLKPKNILVPGGPETPLERCAPKITDFGLAKLLDVEGRQTPSDGCVGTPSYMAPECALGPLGGTITVRADIYSLGAILYECLTGRPPFRAETSLETLQQLLETDPVPPGKLQPKVPRDLETICLKCLQKCQHKRYASALKLAEDLRRFLDGKPIKARPVGPLERGAKWVRRRPVVAALSGVSLLITLVGFGLVAWKWREADEASWSLAEKQRQTDKAWRAELLTSYCLRIALADQAWKANNVVRAEQILDECPADFRDWEWHYLKRLCHQELLTLRAHEGGVQTVAFSPDGQRLISGGNDGTIRIWDATTGREIHARKLDDGFINQVAYSADAEKLASASADGTIRLLNAATGNVIRAIPGSRFPAASVAFCPDHRHIASGGEDGVVRIWDSTTGDLRRTFGGFFTKHNLKITSMAFSPNGQHLASASADGTVKIWAAATGELIRTFSEHQGAVYALAFSPDGQNLASGSADRTVKIWHPANGKIMRVLPSQSNAILSVVFAPNGQWLATAAGDPALIRMGNEVKVWDLASAQEVRRLRGHTDSVRCVAVSQDGTRLATASWDGTVKVWDPLGRTEVLSHSETCSFRTVAFSPDGVRLAAGSDCTLRANRQNIGAVNVWDARTGQELWMCQAHRKEVTNLAYSSDGKHLASSGSDQWLKMWNAASGANVFSLDGRTPRLNALAFSLDGQRLASAGSDRKPKIWDTTTHRELFALSEHKATIAAMAFDSDVKRLAVASGSVVTLWDLTTRKELFHLSGHRPNSMIKAIAFSADGTRLASAASDWTVKVWDTATGAELATLRGHTGVVASVAFSPDGQRIASASWDHTVKIWHATTGQEILTLTGHTNFVAGVAYSPDGTRLASVGWDGTARIWDATPYRGEP